MCERVCVAFSKPTQCCSSSTQCGPKESITDTRPWQKQKTPQTLMSHVSVTLPQDYKQAPKLVEVHLVAVFDPFLGMGLTALGLTECV